MVFDDGREFSQAALRNGELVQEFVHSAVVLNLTGPDDFTNPINRFDVNGKSGVSASDAIQVTNEIARQSFVDDSGNIRELNPVNRSQYRFLDTSGDHRVTAIDALLVINHLARAQVAASGEAVAMLDEGDDPETKVFDSLMHEEQPSERSSKTASDASRDRNTDTPRQNLVSPITARDSEEAEREELFDMAIRELS